MDCIHACSRRPGALADDAPVMTRAQLDEFMALRPNDGSGAYVPRPSDSGRRLVVTFCPNCLQQMAVLYDEGSGELLIAAFTFQRADIAE